MGDDRPRKSWREIDAMKDRSVHRKPGVSGKRGSKREAYQHQKYKSDLERAFSGGGLPEHLAQKLDEAVPADENAKKRQQLRKQLKSSSDPAEVLKLITTLYALDGSLPRAEDVLVPAVEHQDPDIAMEAIEQLTQLHADIGLKRVSLLKTKLKGLVGLGEEPEVEERAERLLAML